MTLRITLMAQGPPTVLALAGGLTGEEVPELSRTVAEAGRPVIFDLTWLLAADRKGMQVLRELKAYGAKFTGVSPYMALLLGDAPDAANRRTRNDRRHPNVAD
jgi:hypothetical protein